MKRDKINDICFLIMGVSLSIFGAISMVRQEFYSSRYGHIDLGQHHYLIGFCLLVVGAWIIYTAWFKKK